MESQIFKQNNLAVLGSIDNLLSLLTNAVWGHLDLLAAKKLLELWYNWLQRILRVGLSIWATQVRHEDDGLGTIINGILDGWNSTGNTLVVGDVLVGIKRDVEVDLETQFISTTMELDSGVLGI